MVLLSSYKTDFLDTIKSSLANGEILDHNEMIWSQNFLYKFTMEHDGMLAVRAIHTAYNTLPGAPTLVWHSYTRGQGTAPYKLRMERYNDLVIYDGTGQALWSSGTNGTGIPGEGKVTFQNDGNVVLNDGINTLWSAL